MPGSATLPASTQSSAASTPRPARWGRRIDTFTVALLILFAFFSASFVARNTDFWLHLATGRMLVSGEYRFGSDPFTYTTADRYWANHSWLFDIGLYEAWQWFGGAKVVAIKAIVVAAIAAIMLLIARGKGPRWIASVCVLLGILALSPRVLLQPVVASYLLLAICLCCLKNGGRAYYLIPASITIWVNVDAWFVLGPMLVVLFWIGCKLESPQDEQSGAWPRWLIPSSVVACLISPHHIHSFTLPLEVSPTVRQSEFFNDPRFAGLFLSAWSWRPLLMAGGYSLVAWAFFILLGLGLTSFAINRHARRSWRSTVWLSFALLAAWQARLIPFFAVVGAPICALNLREAMASKSFIRLGRTFALVVSTMLVLIGYHGRENGFYNRDRGVAWGIHVDPTLSHAAENIAQWNRSHPPEEREIVLNAHVDLGHYMAWFAPGEKYFLDSRLQLFTHVADDYAAISRDLGLLIKTDTDRVGLNDMSQRYLISAIGLYDPDSRRMTNSLRQAASSVSSHMQILRIDGGAVFLEVTTQRHHHRCFNAENLAFGPDTGNEMPLAGNGPTKLAQPAPFWVIESGKRRTGSWEADAATVYLRLFEEERSSSSNRSPALPLLSIRAARVGIEKDPADATAWLVLARAYLLLGQQTWERDAGEALTPLGRIRRIQFTTALVQAVLLNPDSIPAHEDLKNAFAGERAFDLAYQHAAEQLRLMRRGGPTSESTDKYIERIARANDDANGLEQLVQAAENRFLIRTSSLAGDPLARARIAVELGLVQKAIDVLLQSHYDLYGAVGLGLLIDLLLQTGQAADARNLLDRQELLKNTTVLGIYNVPGKPHANAQRWSYRLFAYDWLNLCQHAAVGNYDGARIALQKMSDQLNYEERNVSPPLIKNISRQVAVEIGFAVPNGSLTSRLFAGLERSHLHDLLKQTHQIAVTRADLIALSGLLELERGNPTGALEKGEQALALYAERKAMAPALPGEPLAVKYVGEIRKHKR
ncbi:MAG TPA: hypothetical protein VG097_19535 [Gemmata sp.]|nr:hypothetical protein [Gemmata sp.]